MAAFQVDLKAGHNHSVNLLSDLNNVCLGRAIRYQNPTNDFVGKSRELRYLELDDADWDSIKLVIGWLKLFAAATTTMSATKRPMLSHTHAIFFGLQEDLRTSIRELPTSTPSSLRNGLVRVHEKLSDYYYKTDASPLYMVCM